MTKRLLLLGPILLSLAACSKPPEAPVDATATDVAASADVLAQAGIASDARSPKSSAIPETLRAIGTEPFWSADIAGATLTYGTPDFPAGTSITVARRDGDGLVEWSGTLDGRPLTLRVEKGPCSDGMSDRIYPYRATRTIGPEIEQGCARPR